jgi:hypothetical protein
MCEQDSSRQHSALFTRAPGGAGASPAPPWPPSSSLALPSPPPPLAPSRAPAPLRAPAPPGRAARRPSARTSWISALMAPRPSAPPARQRSRALRPDQAQT